MRFASVCSGIEAASVAWSPLGWKAAFFSEIDKFPCAVLAHHYPDAPNLGDMTGFKDWPDADFDVLVGGTPCQSFSVAGLRKGLADLRGNLALVYLAILERYRPRWMVWENVPGVMSVDGGRAFGSFIRGLAELGYHAAWRTLDAQHCRAHGLERAVPQKRRRVFVVGYLGDWRRATAVLSFAEGMSGHPAPRREARQSVAHDVAPRIGASGRGFERAGDPRGQDAVIAFVGNRQSGPLDVATAVNAHGGPHGRLDFESETFVAHSLRADGFDASEDGTGRGTPLIAFDCKAGANTGFAIGDTPGALRGDGHGGGHAAVAFDMRGREGGSQFEGPHDTANIRAASGGSSRSYVAQQWAVRRLTPLECERLMGFPDGHTAIPYRGKSAADGPRYKALGNSMAVNVVRWIGQRIDLVEAAIQSDGAAA